MAQELIENQRWFPLTGWSYQLHVDDPPAWCTPQQVACLSKDEFPDLEWNCYKGDEYDQDGWLYGESFGGEMGKKTMSSVVRTRVWMGWPSGEAPSDAEMQQNVQLPAITTKAPASSQDEEEDDFVLFPSPDSSVSLKSSAPNGASSSLPPITKTEKENGFSRFMSMAGSSIKEASLMAFESAQAATTNAWNPQPELPPNRRRPSGPRRPSTMAHGRGEMNDEEVQAMQAKKFPDLSPVDRSLVSVCADDVHVKFNQFEPTNTSTCRECGVEFGVTKFRFNCGYCMDSFCREHVPHWEVLHAFGHTSPSRLCDNCHIVLEERKDQQLIQWRNERVKDFLNGSLSLYFNTTSDTKMDKVTRAVGGTFKIAKEAPIGSAAKAAVVSADFLLKYGRTGLLGIVLRNEFMQSFATLKGLIGDVGDLSFQDAALGTYYFMAMNRGGRGANPYAEKEAHRGDKAISDELLTDILRYAPLALHAIYEVNILDLQRIAKLQTFSLVYANLQSQDIRYPSFALLGSKEKKTALLLIRGSKSVQDLLTDIQAHPEEMGGDNGSGEANGGAVDAFAHNGMLKAAMWMKDRIVGSLRLLHQEGYKIVFAGHSLGAGCAALLAIMLQKEFPGLVCYAYAIPACVTYGLAESCTSFVHSIVLRDDVVPRTKASNVVKLVQALQDFRTEWREAASEDLSAFGKRVSTLWAPRKREWAAQDADTLPPSTKKVPADDTQVTHADDASDETSWSVNKANLVEKMEETMEREEKSASVPMEVERSEAEVMEEMIMDIVEDPKELFVPGQVTHMYYHKGIYEAVHVDRRCPDLSQIPVFQNMLVDHVGKSYLNAMRIVRDSRRMKPDLPEWVPFGTKTKCMLCESPFTWNSTSQSEAQQNRDQHNCIRCGLLVCEGCSEKTASIPQYGINDPVRICDRCYFES